MTTLVTGATGTLGRHVVPRLPGARALSRRADVPGAVRGDLSSGAGLDAALDGVDVVLHLAGNPRGGDADMARTLAAAAIRAGSPHVVLISVVGADRIPQRDRIDRTVFGYYGEQAAVERVFEDSGLPLTILCATQFHELLLAAVGALAKLPVAGPPAGRVTELRGPDELSLRDLFTSYLAGPDADRGTQTWAQFLSD